MMYQFSVPMPYKIDDINRLLHINKEVKKSKITSLFFSLPHNCEFYTGFEQDRNRIYDKNWDWWKSLINYSIKSGFDFIYLFNNPARLQVENADFEKQLDKLDKLLIELHKLNVNKLRLANHKLIDYIIKHYPYFDIYASTSFEFQSLALYKNFFLMHPNIKQIVPSHDSIKNFTFLKNLSKMFPNIELMVNEGCMRGCPNRNGHSSEHMSFDVRIRNDISLSNAYYPLFCNGMIAQNPFIALTNSNTIFPWEIDEYAKLNITKFKFVGRDVGENIQLGSYFMYLKGIDDIKNIENVPINTFAFHLSSNPILKEITVKDVRKYLPDINHFKRNGELCAVNCGVKCKYCFKCAEKIQKMHEEKEKKIKFVPACTITY